MHSESPTATPQRRPSKRHRQPHQRPTTSRKLRILLIQSAHPESAHAAVEEEEIQALSERFEVEIHESFNGAKSLLRPSQNGTAPTFDIVIGNYHLPMTAKRRNQLMPFILLLPYLGAGKVRGIGIFVEEEHIDQFLFPQASADYMGLAMVVDKTCVKNGRRLWSKLLEKVIQNLQPA